MQKTQGLLPPIGRLNEIRMLVDIVDKALLILAHLEKIVFLPQRLHRSLAVGAFFLDQVFFSKEAFTGHAIPALVVGGVDKVLVIQLLQYLLYHFLVPCLGGADKVVVCNTQLVPKLLKALHGGVAMRQGAEMQLLGGLLHFQAVLVGAGEKKTLLAQQTMPAGQNISQDRRVGMPYVGLVIDVINRRSNIKILLGHETLR